MVMNPNIISQLENPSGGIDYVLKNGSKLSDVIDFLPNGIINKGVTGIGATTLEIKCLRHSIIVEPLKATVEQKSTEHKELFQYSSQKSMSNSLNQELRKYLLNNKIKYKKIILVIDKLSDLLFELGSKSSDYFFLFDEIDYMQGSSTYRKNMSIGIDLGIALNNFALVSATHIGFSDPLLASQKEYTFKYEQNEIKPIEYYYLTSPKLNKSVKEIRTLNNLYSCICHYLKNSESKILVAVNNIKLISELADSLVVNSSIDRDEISLLISENTHRNDLLIQKYSGRKIENKRLPTRLNFISSAYFNGYDLFEDNLCLIIYSSPNFKSNLISTNEIKQIYGRNRNPFGNKHFFVFTHDIRIDELKDNEFLDYSLQDWLKLGKTSVDMQDCIDNHLNKIIQYNFETSYFARRFKEDVLNVELNLSRQKILFSKNNFLEEFFNPLQQKKINEISYLQIDHLRYYYSQLRTAYVMTEEQYPENDLEALTAPIYVSSVKKMFEVELSESHFKAKELDQHWASETFKKEKKTQKDEIITILNEVILYIKKSGEKSQKLSGRHLSIKEILDKSYSLYTRKSVEETIKSCKSFNDLDLLWGYFSYENFKKSKEYLFIKGNLQLGKKYPLNELVLIGHKAVTSRNTLSNKITSKDKKEALLLVKMVYGLELCHKKGSKTGEKLYKLSKTYFFNTLKPKKSKKHLSRKIKTK
jgi:hypothetical protein